MNRNNEETPIDPNLSASQVKADLLAFKAENERAVQETKERISNFVYNTCLSCFTSNDDKALNDEKVDENQRKTAVDNILKKSITTLTKKAKLDVQVVRLMDQESIKEHVKKMEKVAKQTKQIAKNVCKDLKGKHIKQAQEVDVTKKNIEDTLQRITNLTSSPNANEKSKTFIDYLNKLVEKSATDFHQTSQKTQEITQSTKIKLLNHIQTLFPPSKPTTEQIESEHYVKDPIQSFTTKVVEDVKIQKAVTKELITNTKDKISQYPKEVVEGMKKLSCLSLQYIKEKTGGFEIKENIKEESYEMVELLNKISNDQTTAQNSDTTADHTSILNNKNEEEILTRTVENEEH